MRHLQPKMKREAEQRERRERKARQRLERRAAMAEERRGDSLQRHLRKIAEMGMSDALWVLNTSLDRWLVRLSDGWRLPWIVEPCGGPHGAWAVLMTREGAP